MTPEETQAVAIKAAADNAMLKGVTRIEEAANAAAAPLLGTLQAMEPNVVEQEARGALAAAEQNQTNTLQTMLKVEKLKQEQDIKVMEAQMKQQAMTAAAHVKATAEQWADNQARQYIGFAASNTLSGVMSIADKTAKIRQDATELAKGAIKSAAESLEVAKQAQAAIDNVPLEDVTNAKKKSQELEVKEQALNLQLDALLGSVKHIAEVSKEAAATAQNNLNQANRAEAMAKESLATSRSNAEKIEKLKTRASNAFKKATQAKKTQESMAR